MSRYQVQVRESVFQHVDADHIQVKDGCLVFQDDGQITLVLAPGQWITVHEEESGKTALKLVEQGGRPGWVHGRDASEWRAR